MAANGEKNQSQIGRHQEVGHKSLLQSDDLYQVCIKHHTVTFSFDLVDYGVTFVRSLQYILETSVYPREPEPMKELRELTAKHPWLV